MKKNLLLLSFISSILFTGCSSDSDLMSAVKYSEYNGMLLEDIFEDSDFCDEVTWSDIHIKGKEGVKIVCTVDTDNYIAWGSKLIYNFVSKHHTASFHNAYWADEGGHSKGGGLFKEQAYMLLDTLANDGEDFAKD